MMISVVGISHRTAPVELRERCSLPGEQARGFLRALREEGVYDEGLVLDTCNRTEVYLASRAGRDNVARVLELLRRVKGPAAPREASAFYRHEGPDAVRHLFRVAASLDSQIVGEHQILAQVKDAYRLAVEERTAKFLFNRLLHAAFRTGKRVRTETALGRGSASVAQAAVELAGAALAGLEGKTALFIGAGQTTQLAARALLRGGVRRILVANRTLSRARQLADELMAEAGRGPCQAVRDGEEGPEDDLIRCPALLRLRPDLAGAAKAAPAAPALSATAITLEAVPRAVAQADLVLCATASSRPVLTYGKLAGVLRRRKTPLVVLDIAVPRDVDERVGRLPRVRLLNIDDLSGLVERNLQRRREEVPRAEAIVAEETLRFCRWMDRLRLGPTIRLLQRRFEDLRKAEIRRYGRRFAADGEQLERFACSLCQKLLHRPLAFLNASAAGRGGGDGEEDLRAMDLLRRMFGLEGEGEDS